MEMPGTSDQRRARNGGINIATRSGGPPEYIIDGKSGFLVGSYPDYNNFYENTPADIFDKLLQCSNMYYSQASDTRWIDMMFEAWKASRKVTAVAMMKRYAKNAYAPALRIRMHKLGLDSAQPLAPLGGHIIEAIDSGA